MSAAKGRLPKLERRSVDGYELTDEAKRGYEVRYTGWRVDPRNSLIFDPSDAHRIPKTGAWAMIVRQLPSIAGGIDQHVRVGRIFWIEHEDGSDEHGFRPNGSYKVMLHSPWGDVCLWPYEYARMSTDEIIGAWAKGELTFHPLNMEAARLNEVTFYARSRGISASNAVVMALGSITGAIGWFEPTAEVAAACEELATAINTSLARRRSKPSTRTLTTPMTLSIVTPEGSTEMTLPGKQP